MTNAREQLIQELDQTPDFVIQFEQAGFIALLR
jgi:hypothetical protein